MLFSLLRIVGTLGPSDYIHDHFFARWTRLRRLCDRISRMEPGYEDCSPYKIAKNVFRKHKKSFSIVRVYACHGAVFFPSNKCQCLLEVIRCCHVSWSNWGSCKGLMLCMPSII